MAQLLMSPVCMMLILKSRDVHTKREEAGKVLADGQRDGEVKER